MNNDILIENSKYICDIFVRVDIENNTRYNGFEEKPWKFLNVNCEITDTTFLKPINTLEIEHWKI